MGTTSSRFGARLPASRRDRVDQEDPLKVRRQDRVQVHGRRPSGSKGHHRRSWTAGGAKRAMLRRANARSRTQPRREHTWTFLGVPPGWGPRSAPPIRRRGGGAAAGTGPAGPAVTADPCNAAQGVAAWSPDDSRSRGHSYQWAPAVRRMSRNKNVSHPMGYRTPSRPGPSAEQAPGPLRRTAVLTGTFLDIDVPEASHSSDAYCSGRGATARGRMVGRPRPGPRSHPRPTESQ